MCQATVKLSLGLPASYAFSRGETQLSMSMIVNNALSDLGQICGVPIISFSQSMAPPSNNDSVGGGGTITTVIGAAAGGAGVVAIVGFAFYMFKTKTREEATARTADVFKSQSPDGQKIEHRDRVVTIPSDPEGLQAGSVVVGRANGTRDALIQGDNGGSETRMLQIPPLMSKGIKDGHIQLLKGV